ncbi:lipid storage droplets surface-binding protein 2-like isoform X2 [Zootermopsis nevadensis]|uniref:Lipid storage droplets surface-binding protein 2 n=2 Tax=Zootermopsis nevadensis TaxID=136037 RepID=A0A067RKH1_ZOONE|nr:lipid storage droplets surface-binding protein 2-like isoform X2 [Zootermopsis nevadensis]XP_021913959.1 lipid storage droplets surface-binding protein 2-like isoform X2 [Zootermopsis nevadensis]KDR24317.1 Lipid storage droplets surface-binding protein 2 [Zootermopsis nevadensis]
MAEPHTTAVPRLECVDKVCNIPVVEMAYNQTADLYKKVKEANGVLTWTLSAAEATILKAAEHVAPVARKLERPIHAVDQTLCKAIEIVEEKFPLVKEPPSNVRSTAMFFVQEIFSPMERFTAMKDYGTRKAHSFSEMSVTKANEMLATRYGAIALSGFETTAALAEKYLDYYFPATEQELQEENEPPAAEGDDDDDDDDDDKVMNTFHTMGRLSNKFARRVYNILSSHVKQLDYDEMQQYIKSVSTIMHLTNYLQSLNEHLRAVTSSNKTESAEGSSGSAQKTEEKKSTIA